MNTKQIVIGTKVKYQSLNPVRRKQYTGTVMEKNTDNGCDGQWWIAPDVETEFDGDIVNWVSRSENEIELV